MKAKMTYPVLAKGIPKGARNLRTGLVFEDMEFDIPEVSDADAPVALAIHAPENQTEFPEERPLRIRFHDGKHYRLAQNHQRFSKDYNDRMGLPGFAEITNRLLNTILSEVKAMTYGGAEPDYWPVSARKIKEYNRAAIGLVTHRKPAEAFTITEEGFRTAKRWRDAAERATECLLVVDGELWEQCDEPVYSVDTKSSPGVMVTGGTPLAAFGSSHFRFHGFATPSLQVFNAAEHELAVAAKERAEPFRRIHAGEAADFIEVLRPEAVTYPAAERELDRLARYMIDDFAGAVENGTKQYRGNWFRRVPSAVLTAYTAVKDIVDGYDPFKTSVPEELEPAVERLKSELDRVDQIDGVPLRERVTDAEYEALMGRYQDRDIEMRFSPVGGKLAVR